jgi:hypothetical protein
MTQKDFTTDKVAPETNSVIGRSNALAPQAGEGATPFNNIYNYFFGWSSPTTYDNTYKEPPITSGVYAIVTIDYFSKELILQYIGSTSNLFARYHGHPVLKKLRKDNYASFFFKEIPHGFYDEEINLIKEWKPFLNKQHNK